jgi:hypothetical protein
MSVQGPATSITSCRGPSRTTDQGNGRLDCPTHNRHDTDATPQPLRLTGLDAFRARARWWCSYHDRASGDDDGADEDPEQLAG